MKHILYEPSERAKQVWREKARAKYRFLVGAVRASKSFTANDIAIEEIQKLPSCNVLISGYSITSVARNVMEEWKKIIDPFELGLFQTHKVAKNEYITINWRGLRDKKFYIRGSGKENDFKQIQGATFGYWYADELTRHHESFVDMAMSRMSLPYSTAIWTSNPDNPMHWAKTRFLDDKVLYEEDKHGFSEFKTWNFTLEDNPSLDGRTVAGLKKLYTGVFFKRFILGMWVAAKGAVYDFFDTCPPYFISPVGLPQVKQRAIGIDYGTNNPTSFGQYGLNRQNDGLQCWRERGWYHDGSTGFRLTDSEIADKLEEFIEGVFTQYVILDPAAASLRIEIQKRALPFMLLPADNSVLDGIRTQMSMLKNGLYAIVDEPSNQQCVLDYGAYMWDPKAKEKGEDKPIKQHDHTKDEERYILQTLFGADGLDYSLLTKR